MSEIPAPLTASICTGNITGKAIADETMDEAGSDLCNYDHCDYDPTT